MGEYIRYTSTVKKSTNLLQNYKKDLIVNHAWGQSPESVYNQLVSIWNGAAVGNVMAVFIRKKHGFAGVRDYLDAKNLQPKTTGKGPDGLRIIEITKSSDQSLVVDRTVNTIDFEFRGKSLKADVGGALFSRSSLDIGTRHLLDYVVGSGLELNGKSIADLGAGWGAIGIVLSSFYDDLAVAMYENDAASLAAAETNLGKQQSYKYYSADITSPDAEKDLKAIGVHDYIVCNPPFHITKKQRKAMFQLAKALLKPGGELVFVVEQHFADRFYDSAIEYFKLMKQSEHEKFTIYHYIKDGKPT